MKILAVSNLYPPYHGGGYGLQTGWFCRGLASRGHQIVVLTGRPEGAATDAGSAPTVPVLREFSLLPSYASPRALLAAVIHNRQAVRRAVRAVRPDVVFVTGIDGVGFNTYHAAIDSNVPSLTWLGDTWLAQAWRDLPEFDPYVDLARGGRRAGLGRWAKQAVGAVGRLAGLVDGQRPTRFAPVVCISSFVAADLAAAAGVPLPPVVPILLDRAFFRPDGAAVGRDGSTSQALRALFVGRTELLKGPDVAIDAVAAAVVAGADVRLTLAGLRQEQMRSELEERAVVRGVADRLAWVGSPPHDELIRLYRRHDVFLFPSRIVEGLGVVNCEAMACGLPVIGTADSGAADVIHDNETGFRVPINDPIAMAKCLVDMYANRDKLAKLSVLATAFSERFHPDRVLGLLEAELQNVIAGYPA
jgi:glycosyltransferase involved in cell wall biosynthesis